jgi:putative holliday junction resolvase
MKAASCSTSESGPFALAPDSGLSSTSPLPLPILALDVGLKRIGVAVSDRLGISSRGIACLHRRDRGWPRQALKLAEEYGCKGLLVGLARNMDGSEGPQAADCRAAAAELSELTELPLAFWDERLSSWTAKERLRAQGLSEKKVAERVDQTAAAVILEDYLAAHPASDRG